MFGAGLSVTLLAAAPVAAAEPLVVPFDFSRSAIGIEVTFGGTPLYTLLDTGVEPSVIDLARADALGLKVDRAESGGEASGFGEGKPAPIYPVRMTGLVVGGHSFAPIDTGSNGGIALYQSALGLPGLRGALVPDGTVTHSGARGDATSPAFRFTAPVGFGPFTLPPGQQVILHSQPGSPSERVANIGNRPFAELTSRYCSITGRNG